MINPGIKLTIPLLTVLLLFSVVPLAAWGHPGGTDSSGCHTCRTNCPRWGRDPGQYHCRSARTPTPDPPVRPPPRSASVPAVGCKQRAYETNRCAVVVRVIDGDTIVLSTGERVRYIGIDTPERGDRGFDAATARNTALVEGKTVTLDICEETPKDRFGRTLAYVIVGTTVINEVLLSEGYAAALHIPPCGKDTADCYKALVHGAVPAP